LCVVKTSVGQVFDFCDNHQFQANETTESKNCWVWVFAKTSESKNCQFQVIQKLQRTTGFHEEPAT
jgi:hypothetical protein